jgi:hypothetical protein
MLSRFKISVESIGRAIERMDARVLNADEVQSLRGYLPSEEEIAMLKVDYMYVCMYVCIVYVHGSLCMLMCCGCACVEC